MFEILEHLPYFISCSIPTPFLFIFMSWSDRFLGGQDSLSSKSSSYFEFFLQELMVITASSLAVSFDFRQLGRRLVLQESITEHFLF